ncbi:MAG: 2-amino-4-hydroxy-6-hydroxymethyldihydropteridine diphosphokinase [Hyphomonadaceae bacterium]|nr:2-amino-4-hydroxy-6-hydroxymethyldihydropteridine diphosphokinase [Hyphomonadaceae bacterium]
MTSATRSNAAAYIALGSNLPHAGVEGPALLEAALRALGEAGLELRRASSIWRTAPWPPAVQNDFHNAAIEVDAGCRGPEAVFELTSAIERAFGRERRARWDARTLDLDLIDFAGLSGTFGPVQLPHPRAHERAFVLAPLAELGWRHPTLGRTAAELLAALPSGQEAIRIGSFTAFCPPP